MKPNPWGITEREAMILSAVIERGGAKAAARAINKSKKTVDHYICSAKRKMVATGDCECWSKLQHYIAWDRWVREQGRADASS